MVHIPFSTGGAVLLKDVIPQAEREFFPTEAEWHARHTEQIKRFAEVTPASGTPQSIFTVPANHTLFVTYCWCTVRDAAANGSSRIEGFNGAEVYLSVFGTIGQQSASFLMPIKVNAGETIELDAGGLGTTGNADGGIIGWLEKTKKV